MIVRLVACLENQLMLFAQVCVQFDICSRQVLTQQTSSLLKSLGSRPMFGEIIVINLNEGVQRGKNVTHTYTHKTRERGAEGGCVTACMRV